MVQIMVRAVILAALLVAGTPAFAQPPASQPAPETEPTEPKIVCTMEPITGTRAKKQQVCKTRGYERGTAAHQQMLDSIQRATNVQPPANPGIRPGGPGF